MTVLSRGRAGWRGLGNNDRAVKGQGGIARVGAGIGRSGQLVHVMLLMGRTFSVCPPHTTAACRPIRRWMTVSRGSALIKIAWQKREDLINFVCDVSN